jgi:hypothetical protein
MGPSPLCAGKVRFPPVVSFYEIRSSDNAVSKRDGNLPVKVLRRLSGIFLYLLFGLGARHANSLGEIGGKLVRDLAPAAFVPPHDIQLRETLVRQDELAFLATSQEFNRDQRGDFTFLPSPGEVNFAGGSTTW